MSEQTLTATDNRTGKAYELPIKNETIRAMDLRKIKTDADDFGLMSYDPAFMNTASVQERDHVHRRDKGILRYRGYPIEQLAERCTYLEVAYLILHGELPTGAQLKEWSYDITHHTFIHENDQEADRRLPLRRPSHGHVHQHRRGALDVLPRCEEIFDPESRRTADLPADRQGADDRRVHLPPQAGHALTSIPTTT